MPGRTVGRVGKGPFPCGDSGVIVTLADLI